MREGGRKRHQTNIQLPFLLDTKKTSSKRRHLSRCSTMSTTTLLRPSPTTLVKWAYTCIPASPWGHRPPSRGGRRISARDHNGAPASARHWPPETASYGPIGARLRPTRKVSGVHVQRQYSARIWVKMSVFVTCKQKCTHILQILPSCFRSSQNKHQTIEQHILVRLNFFYSSCASFFFFFSPCGTVALPRGTRLDPARWSWKCGCRSQRPRQPDPSSSASLFPRRAA